MKTGEIIWPLRREVKDMLTSPGVYLAGDSRFPMLTVPLISVHGKVYCMRIDKELAPGEFTNTMTLKGPYMALE